MAEDPDPLPDYRNWAEKRGHAYGEIVAKTPYKRRVLSENRSNEIASELKDYFIHEEERSEEEAENLTSRVLNHASQKSFEVVKNAEPKGYLSNFNLHEPWHPKDFLNGDLITYPYQHDSA